MTDTTRFFQAIVSGDVAQVRALLEEHPGLAHARDPEGATALHIAAFQGNRLLVSLLCAKGADLNARDARFGATPSGWAIHYLRELGGLLAIEIEDVLHAIRTHDALWAYRLVKRHPALINAADAEGKPLAAHARESGDRAIADLFVSSTRTS
jgi:ankyrin repeat protein